MRSWLWAPPRRATEASPQQVALTGAGPGSRDPVDGTTGWIPAGSTGRPVPPWTLERARTHSVAAYRMNPMARAIIDTYTSFCVGDSGVRLEVSEPRVRAVAEEFWSDPRNALADRQVLLLRDAMLMGEQIPEFLVGERGRRVRFRPIDPTLLEGVELEANNPLWPQTLVFRPHAAGDEPVQLSVVQSDDATGLRTGQAMFWAPWRTLVTDRRGMPFLTPILDWLDSYDQVLSNLIDRTALARHVAFDVTVDGDQPDIDLYVAARGGLHVPPSGSVEVHNKSVEWKVLNAQAGAFEDTATAGNVLTLIAGGSGLAKHWLAEPEQTNRATGQTMAEPVRRRVGGVQRDWLAYMTDMVRFAVDQAVAAGRLPRTVAATDERTGQTTQVPAAQCVQVLGPQIAQADSQITAEVMLNLSTGLKQLVETGVLGSEAAGVAARVAWESYTGITWTADLNATPEQLAAQVAAGRQAPPTQPPPDQPRNGLRPVPAPPQNGSAASG
jgi:hypothetical protein